MTPSPLRPPVVPRTVVRLVAPRDARCEVLGDLQERFLRRVARQGGMRARWWYWMQSLDASGRFTAERIVEFFLTLARLPHGGRHMIGWFIRDSRFALRNLRRTPGFAAAAVLTLALGVGANTAIFSVVNGVILRPLPFPEPGSLATVWTSWGGDPNSRGSMSLPDLRDVQAEASSLQSLAGYSVFGVTLTGMGEPEVVEGGHVTDGLLGVFQLAPMLGRDIRAQETAPDGPRVVVIGHTFWQERFSGDASVVGRTIQLDGRAHEIIGVAPAAFSFPGEADLWMPRYLNPEHCGRGCHTFRAIARLAPDVSLEAAGVELRNIAARLEAAYPEQNFEKSFAIQSLADTVFGEVRAGLYILLGAVALVLLIACANVANLLLVRGSTRNGEIAVRSALGASRGGLIRQLMIEALVLASLGGLVGVALARLGVTVLIQMAPSNIPRLEEVSLDLPVLLFAFGSVFLVTLLFGLIPALRVSAAGVAGVLHEGGRGTPGGRQRQWFRSSLLIAEVAMSLVLLSGAGLLLKSFARLRAVDLGFRSDSVVSFTIDLPAARYDNPEDAVQFFERLESRLGDHASITSVGSVFGRPLGSNNASVGTEFLDRPPVPEGQEPGIAVHVVTPNYLQTIGVPLIRGRMLAQSDRLETERAAVVSQKMVDRYYPDTDPIGKQIRMSFSFGFDISRNPITIVGVVGDVRTRSISREPVPEVYMPQAQMGSTYLTVVVRGNGPVSELFPIIRAEVRQMDPNLPLRDVDILSEAVDRSFGSARFHLTLLSVFAGVAVALAAIGLYGVVAYLVSQRRREIGVRIALGASGDDVVRLVVRQTSKPILIGLITGVAGTVAASRVLNSLLYEVPARDPVTLVVVTGILAVVVLAAVLVPARRASQIAPLLALREQ